MDNFYPIPTSRICLVALAVFIIVGLAGRAVSACEGGAGGPWPDAGFGSSGRVLIPFEHDDQPDRGSAATGVIRLNDERLFVAGVATRQHSSIAFHPAGAAAMLNSDGTIDTCFEENGRWVQALPGLQESLFRDLVRHGDRIYLVGIAEVPRDDDPSLMRRDILIAAFTLSGRIFSDRFE